MLIQNNEFEVLVQEPVVSEVIIEDQTIDVEVLITETQEKPPVEIVVQGPQGPQGPVGPQGPAGEVGEVNEITNQMINSLFGK